MSEACRHGLDLRRGCPDCGDLVISDNPKDRPNLKPEKTEKNSNTTANAAPVVPLPAAAPAPTPKKRIRNRSKAPVAIPGGPGPVSASEGAAKRIDELLEGLRARRDSLLEAQREKPGRWEYFAALADLEERLRRVLP